ncbi:hypothetical protein BDF19DRAFT_433736 [Syncephalis fuscata]|nr:hypothetical protein BDF19DRAFT_433736 [Syncephalis fuscata]
METRVLQELNKAADAGLPEVRPEISLRVYLRSVQEMHRQARSYLAEDDIIRAYILFLRYVTLVLKELPKHPQYKEESRTECNETIARLESLKPMVLTLAEKNSTNNDHLKRNESKEPSKDIASTSVSNSNLPSASSSESRIPLSQEERHQIRGALNDGSWTNTNRPVYPELASNNQSDRIYPPVATAHNPPLPPLFDPKYQNSSSPPPSSSLYPGGSVAMPTPFQKVSPFLPPIMPANKGHQPPQVPPRFHFPTPKTSHSWYPGRVQPMPSHNVPMYAHNAPYPSGYTSTPPTPKPASKPKLITKPAPVIREEPIQAVDEGGEPLRSLYLPQGIIKGFLQIAHRNTARNVETCGILCGILSRNAFRVTTLIIPKQSATSDTCQTEDEGSLFDELDKRDLMTLGWIHTHPTQTCFMSSVDLHTHAVAVVCSPRHTPIIRLTRPPGIGIIQNCRQKGAFHPHPNQPLYTDITRDGHVFFYAGDYETIDIR